MTDPVYTHALWRVRSGQDHAFISAWSELAEVFSSLPDRPLWGTLIRSTADRSVFYSFGPWRSLEDAIAMRNDPRAQRAIARVREICSDATPEICELVRDVRPEHGSSPDDR